MKRYYCDSGVFCAYLSKEDGRWKEVRDILEEALAGRVELFTSTFSLVEVLKVKGHSPLDQKTEEKIESFFQYPFIKFVEPTRSICEGARVHVWKDGMKPKDALHLASALFLSRIIALDGLFSYDNDFTRLNGKVTTAFSILPPQLDQGLLQFGDSDGHLGEQGEDL